MKLRNKKTGEINLGDLHLDDFNSLAELNEEWEDYEEPKEYFYIYANQVLKGECDGFIEDRFKEVGNYFETKEEAEKALEKLKAWKRLKDSGISFEAKVIDGRWYLGPKVEPKPRTFDEVNDLFKDVMFVFGGEDESNQ